MVAQKAPPNVIKIDAGSIKFLSAAKPCSPVLIPKIISPKHNTNPKSVAKSIIF
jgi:hypothetical protein